MLTKFNLRSAYAKNTMVLMAGTSVSQALTIVISPFLTRIYSPSDMGIFSLYIAIVTILTTVATGRYELSIMLPADHYRARQGVALVTLISAVVSFISLVLVHFFKNDFARLLNAPAIENWLYFVPLSLFLSSLSLAFNYWNNRQRRFKNLAVARVGQGAATSAAQISLGKWIGGPLGLLGGNIIGLAANAAVLGCSGAARSETTGSLEPISWANLKAYATKYRKFPLLQGPSTFIENFSAQLPVLLLSSFFGAGVVGFFALSQRVVRLPLRVIGTSIGDVFREKVSAIHARGGNTRKEFIAVFKLLSAVSVAPFLIFAFLAPALFAFVFGEGWRAAGEYAQILTPLFWASFVASPLSVMFIVTEKQEIDLVIQAALLTLSAAAMAVGHYVFHSPKVCLALLSGVYFVKYVIELYLSYLFCQDGSAVVVITKDIT